MSKEDKAKLVKRAQDGDQRALERLLRSHYPAMYRLALRYCRDHGMAEDAVQETSIQVLKNINRLRREDRFSSWVNQIVVNSVRQQQRKNRRLIPCDFYERIHTDTDEPSPSERLVQQQQLELADRYLKTRRAQDRALFIKLYVEGRSLGVVSEDTGLSVSAIKTRIHRARLRLRDYFNAIEREAA